MKLLNTIVKFAGKSKKQIVDHGPQIAAVAGVAFFIAGTVYAVKETPNAMKKLEAKKALDKDMTKLQQAAVIVPEYKKTIACAAAGIAFTGLSWHLEAKYVAYLTAMLSTAKEELLEEKKNSAQLLEAAKEVVGDEKTEEIKAKKEEIEQNEREFVENTGWCGSDDCVYLFRWPCGVEMWMTWADYKRKNDEAMKLAASKHELKMSDYFEAFGLERDKITKYMKETGWQPSASQATLCENVNDWLRWAGKIVDYSSRLVEKDHFNHIALWQIEWTVSPESWDDELWG